MNEAARLDALARTGLLDTPREQDFDQIADLASRICDAPIGVVNLVSDSRQFFKAEVGLGVRETPLDSSFCAKAILEDEFLLIPDATKDGRFNCNPLVTGVPGFKFYAGALLRTADGHAIGTVCVLDYKVRDLSPLQQDTLKVLARQVMRQIELRQAVRARNEALQHQAFLNGELTHRMKNTLAMVQAIVKQTLKDVEPRDAVEALDRRIAALGAAHDQLIREDWTAAPIHKITRLLLDLHGDSGRIRISGPPLDIGPRATISVSMLLHELATNATKHGALSVPDGRVDLSWRIEAGATESMFRMNWTETGGPRVVAPLRSSFGSRLIKMGLVGKGGVEQRYLPEGLAADFVASMTDVQEL